MTGTGPAMPAMKVRPAGDCVWEIPPSEKPGMRRATQAAIDLESVPDIRSRLGLAPV